MLWKHISLLSLRSYGNPHLKMMDIPIDIFLTLLNKWENRHTMSVIPTSYTWHNIQYISYYVSVSSSFISYILHLYIFSLHMYMSCHLHVIKGYLFINAIITCIGPYIKHISHSGMQSLTIKSSPQQKPPHSYFLIPLSADTHLMDPLLFPLSVFHHTSQMPASPLLCFLQSSSSSLFTLSLSLPFCDLVRKTETILGGTGNPQLQTERLTDWGT